MSRRQQDVAPGDVVMKRHPLLFNLPLNDKF